MNIPTEVLLKHVKICSTVVSTKDKDELIYRGIRITCTMDSLTLSANGNFNMIVTNFSDEEMETVTNLEELDIIVEATKLFEILYKATVDTVKLKISSKKSFVELIANGKSKLRYVTPELLNPLPEYSNKINNSPISLEKLNMYLSGLNPFVGEDIHKTALVGACFDSANLYGTDESKALILRDIDIDFPEQVVISIELLEVTKLILSYESDSTNWNSYLSDDGAFFILESEDKNYVIYIHKYNIDYPVELLEKATDMARSGESEVTFSAKELKSILDRLSIFKDENDILFLKVFDDRDYLRIIIKNLKTGEQGFEDLQIISSENLSSVIIPVSYSAISIILETFSMFLDELSFKYSAKDSKFVCFSEENEFDCWVVQNVIDYDDNDLEDLGDEDL